MLSCSGLAAVMVDIKNDDMKILNSKVEHTSNTVHKIDKSKATITYDVIGERISRKLHVSTRHVACRRNTELILQNLDLSSSFECVAGCGWSSQRQNLMPRR